MHVTSRLGEFEVPASCRFCDRKDVVTQAAVATTELRVAVMSKTATAVEATTYPEVMLKVTADA